MIHYPCGGTRLNVRACAPSPSPAAVAAAGFQKPERGVPLRDASPLARGFARDGPRSVLLERVAEADHLLPRLRQRLVLRHG